MRPPNKFKKQKAAGLTPPKDVGIKHRAFVIAPCILGISAHTAIHLLQGKTDLSEQQTRDVPPTKKFFRWAWYVLTIFMFFSWLFVLFYAMWLPSDNPYRVWAIVTASALAVIFGVYSLPINRPKRQITVVGLSIVIIFFFIAKSIYENLDPSFLGDLFTSVGVLLIAVTLLMDNKVK